MYIKYGSFSFEPWEASLTGVSVQAKYSPRGFRESLVSQMFVSGDVVEEDQYAVSSRLSAIAAALANDYQDFGLYHDDNSPTEHHMISSHPDNMTGNQVFMKNFPAQIGGEYVNGRQFSFGVKAEFAAWDSALLEYRDTYHAVGKAGPIWEWENTPQGIIARKRTPNSFQRVIHSGYAKTTVPWFLPPEPYYNEPFHLGHLQSVTYHSPLERYPQYAQGYMTQWTYHYCLPIDVFNTPTVR